MISFKRIKTILRTNKDAKSLASNFFFLSLLKGISFVFPLITLPYLTKVIGVENFGIIAFASSIIIFAETITDWGFNYTATRDVAQNRTDTAYVSRIFSEVLFSKIILMTICFILLYLCILFIPQFHEYKIILLYTFTYIPGYILFPEWLFQAFERMKYITIMNVIAKTIFTILIFIVIKEQSDYIYQPLLTASGFALSGLIAQYIIFHTFRIRIIFPTFNNLYKRLKNSTNMFISLLLPNLYTNFSTILLKSFCGEFSTGIYSAGQRFQTIVDQFTQILSRTFFPFLARKKEKHYIYVRISGCISIAACIFLFITADWLIDIFYTPEFTEATKVLRIFAISPFFLFLMNTYGTNYLVIIGKENILRNIILICSILGFILSWLLTPMFGYIGAAVTVTSIWGIRGFLTYIYARKLKNNNI